LCDIVGLLEAGEAATMGNNFEAAVVDFEGVLYVSDISNIDVGMVFEFQVVDSLHVRVEAIMGREKAPIWFFGFVECELLKVLEGSRYIRHEVFLSINVG
jgi:hypothetical protein